MVPLVGAVWSCAPTTVARVPGPLPVPVPRQPRDARPSAARRSGGRSSAAVARYVEAVANRLDRGARVEPGASASSEPPTAWSSTRRPAHDARSSIATHADQALAMLADPTRRRAPRCWARSRTPATRRVLHTDGSLLPADAAAPGRRGTTSSTPARRAGRRARDQLPHEPAAALVEPLDYCVTLNGSGRIDAGQRARAGWSTSTPSTRAPAVAAQRRLPAIRATATRVRRRVPRLGLPRGRLPLGRARGRRRWGARGDVPRLYEGHASCTTRRARRGCGTRSATASTCGWSTSTTLPRRCPRLASTAARHAIRSARPPRRSGPLDPRRTSTPISAPTGVDLDGGAVLLLTNARVLGLRVQPAHGLLVPRPGRRRCACVVAEVHNTYGERHCYLLDPGERGRGRADKEFYVSPFLDRRRPLPDGVRATRRRLAIQMSLEQDGRARVRRVSDGARLPLTNRSLGRMLVRYPLMTAKVTTLIHLQGLRLHRRGVAHVRRRRRAPQEGVG